MSDNNKLDSSIGFLDNQQMPNDGQMPEEMPKVEKVEEKADSKPKTTKYKDGYKWSFLAIVISIVVVSTSCFYGLACHYKAQTEEIVSIQKNDAKEMQNLINASNVRSHDSQKFISDLQTVLDQHAEREEALLELSFSKLQSDFNFISLWAGLITIVFLVFSIFSIFRTDEMLKQAQNSSSQIDGLLEQAKSEFDDIDSQTHQTIISYKQITKNEVDRLHKDIEDLRTELEQIEKIILPFGK